ncbi:hypothetical protein FACS189462_3520 [Spirochaetia bacterium]|nr:hypothetical protein FACS189462_3520 [Spirochaetia bacterium]
MKWDPIIKPLVIIGAAAVDIGPDIIGVNAEGTGVIRYGRIIIALGGICVSPVVIGGDKILIHP